LYSAEKEQIDMAAVSKVLNLSIGAVSKRWSRLKQSMESGKIQGSTATTYEFLWLCVKHNKRDKVGILTRASYHANTLHSPGKVKRLVAITVVGEFFLVKDLEVALDDS
jgi:hypothetical protein